jgi:undecaprenyl-phosphate 4-deoxy-4-formamido-L-arabinose transferase
VTFLSFFVFIASSSYALYTLLRKLIYNDLVTGFATFAIMGGLGLAFILFSLGIIGEYILRINLKTTQRPNYIVKENVD